MRPTVDEQLRGMRRILVEVVQPQVVDDYAREQLGHVTAALGPLADGWDAVVPGLLRENVRLETLLRTILPDLERLAVDPELLARVGEVGRLTGSPSQGEWRFEPHDARHRVLRGLVVDLVAGLDALPDDARVESARTEIEKALRRGLED